MKIKGVIFDMDGVILDTEKLYNRFWREAAAKFGYEMSFEQALAIRSMNPVKGASVLKNFFGEDFPYEEVKACRKKMMGEYVKINGVEKKKGVDELFAFLKENRYKIAVATSSNRERAKRHLSHVGMWEAFDEIVCGDSIKAGKPEPDIYLTAAEKLGLSPRECLALEDSPAGIQSAARAGCHPVFVPDLDEADWQIRAQAEYVVNSLTDVIELIKNKEGSKK